MDAPAVLSAPEGLLEQLGLSKAGDRLNLVAYCKTTHEKPNESQQKKKALLEAFLSRKKMKKSHKTKELTSVEKKKEKIKNKQVQLGWKHFREQDDAYVLVPLSKGGGSRTVDVPVTISRFELHQMCKSLFFPDGQSLLGKADDMLMDLADFKDEKISDTITVGADCTVPFNVANYMEAHKIKTVRLYLRSKLLTTNSDDDLYHSPFDIKEVMPPVELNEGSSLIGSSEDRKALKEEQDEVYRVSLLTDEKGCADQERKLHDEKRKERLQRARMERVLPEPSSDFVTVKIRHPSLGLQSRKFPTHTLMNSVYDWAGSLATEPEHFTLNDPLGRMLLPISELDDRCTLTMIESQEGTPSLLSSDDEVDFLGFGPAVDTSEFSGWFTEFDEPDIQGSRDAQYSVFVS